MESENVFVVLPAGGCGVRMELDTPKQYCQVLNRPLILYTIQSFHKISWIKQIVVVVGGDYMEMMGTLMKKHNFSKVHLTLGATTRHRSIYNGVKALDKVCKPEDVVLIHDAVRMFTDEQTIHSVTVEAKNHKAAGVYRSLISTVIAPDSEGFLEESLDRNKYRASEMPQGFHYSVISSAYQKATDYDFDYGTECLLLAMKYSGVKAKLIEGSSNLWKVTHKKDLYAAEGVLKEAGIPVHIHCCDQVFKSTICNKLRDKKFQVIQNEHSECGQEKVLIKVINSGESLPDFISQTVTKFTNSCHGNQYEHYLSDRVIGFVIKLKEESEFLTCVKIIQNVKKKIAEKEILIYCFVYQEDCEQEALTDLMTSVIFNRDPALSGQVLVAHN